jgi:hypothetical protein
VWPLAAGHAAGRYCVVHLHLACVARVPGLAARSARGREVAMGKPNQRAPCTSFANVRFARQRAASHGGPLSWHVPARLARTRGPGRQPVAPAARDAHEDSRKRPPPAAPCARLVVAGAHYFSRHGACD